MTKELLNEMFDYKDGNLFYKIKTGLRVKIGDVAGSVKTNGYRQIIINYKAYRAHRLIWMFHNGDIKTGLEIDHINQNKSDNRIENLRLATRSQNKSNGKKYKNNTSRFKGVCWHKRNKKWVAQIKYNNKKIYLGYFATPELAREAYVAAAEKLHGDFACWE
jgi:hypothetical protein